MKFTNFPSKSDFRPIFTSHVTLMSLDPIDFDSSACPDPTNIFVNYLPKDFTKQNLVDLGSPYGVITSAKVMIDLQTGESRCFGFIKYDTPEAARMAVLGLDGLRVGSKVLMARFSNSAENTGAPSATIAAKSLPRSMPRQAIWNLFRPYGEIVAMDFIEDVKKNFMGKALISFKTVETANRAMQALNHSTIEEGEWPLFLQYSEKVATGDIQTFKNEVVIQGIRVERKRPRMPQQAVEEEVAPPPDTGDWMDAVFGDE
jgi:RNA recognition motif-containing protein